MDSTRQAIRGVAEEISKELSSSPLVGLGSGSTVAALIEELSPLALAKHQTIRGVATSTQIEMAASRSGIGIVPFRGAVDLVIDGADQVDSDLNLIKGGGGALLREKVVMSSAKRIFVVASESKFSNKLCDKGVKVPVEVFPMARESAKTKLSQLGGLPEERLLPKGYPFFTENGNLVLDTAFEPIDDPSTLERNIKSIPGVAEVGIFTIKPINVFRIKTDGSYDSMR